MEENFNNDRDDDIFALLRKIKRLDDFNFSLMDREELKAYIVAQMEKIEREFPKMVEYIEPEDQGFIH